MSRTSIKAASESIASHLSFAPRYVRSFEIERDLGDPLAVRGYMLTPAVLFAAQTLASGLRKASTQRAWRITGPYGAGKSAFGLFLAHLAARSVVGKQLLNQVKAEAPDLFDAWQDVPRYLPIAVTGTRTPFGTALVGRLRRSIQDMSTRRPPKILGELQKLEARSATHVLPDEQVARVLAQFVEYTTTGVHASYDGVLLIVDEMGKFLEHAALHPEQADAHLFQRIAEMAAGGSKAAFGVVGFLHQNFADYAAGYGERAQEEWSKVAQRFEDIPFDESLEQYGFLLASAMQYRIGVLHAKGIEAHAKHVCGKLLEDKGKAKGREVALVAASPNLYPIHPSVFLTLATAVKRFGQNQRSLFSFLLAGEAHGLQQYIHATRLAVENWYRLPRLYDYLAGLDGIAFRQGDRARKWELLKDTLAHGPALEPLERDVLKAVGILNVLDPVAHLAADLRTLSLALVDAEKSKDIESALASLTVRKVLFHRRAQGDYCLWRHSSVDLHALREEAAKATRPVTTLDDLLASIGQGRALIAHRHYQETGTLRAFRVRYLSMAQAQAARAEAVSDYDGEVLVLLSEPGQDIAKAVRMVAGHALSENPARLIALRRFDPADLQVATEIRIWDRIAQTCQELRVDDFARREVAQELDQARRKLEARLSSIAGFSTVKDDTTWIHRGRRVEIKSRKALSMLLSRICDEVYRSAPLIQNELINRHKLSSAVSLARQRLITQMLQNGHVEGLGLKGTPPERAIYLSVFQDSGLHRAQNGSVGFYPPRPGTDRNRWLDAWEGLRSFLSEQGNVSFDKILAYLRQSPYGMREGPALLFVLAFILRERRNIALFERNTYQVELTDDHVQRLTKSPGNFTLHLQPRVGGVEGLFQAYASALEPIRRKGDELNDVHGIVSCIYRWHAERSEYVSQTARLTPKAKDVRTALKRAGDPMDLVTTELPKACGYPNLVKSTGKKQLLEFSASLQALLVEIDGADAALRQEILAVLNGVFRIDGTVAELREYLENNFAAYREILGDYKLKAALTRALDKALPDDAWIESMAALLGERTIGLWKDDTLDKFRGEAKVFAGQLQRWAALMLEHTHKKASAGSLIRVHVTAASGKELILLVNKGGNAGVSGDELKRELRRVIDLNRAEAPLALAEALAELLARVEAKEKLKDAKD